jgi:hypothetical protein
MYAARRDRFGQFRPMFRQRSKEKAPTSQPYYYSRPHSEIESALRKHGRVDARKIADLASGPHAVFIEVHDSEQAEDLVDTLNEITDVRATIIDAEITE